MCEPTFHLYYKIPEITNISVGKVDSDSQFQNILVHSHLAYVTYVPRVTGLREYMVAAGSIAHLFTSW